MYIYLVLLIIRFRPVNFKLDIISAILFFVCATTSSGLTRLMRIGFLLVGLSIALNAFNDFYAMRMNTRVLFIMNTIHAILSILGLIILAVAVVKMRQKSGR